MRLLVTIAVVLVLWPASVKAADWDYRIDIPPLNMAWQCNDIRVTIIVGPQGVMYDLGGSIWGGSKFFFMRDGQLLFNGRPCALLAPIARR
jgi:hypothetical protein